MSAKVAASPQLDLSAPVVVSIQVAASGQFAASCSYETLAHPTILWHHRLGHPLIPRLSSMACFGSPARRSVAPSLAWPAMHSLIFRPPAPHFALLPPSSDHCSLLDPPARKGPERECYNLVVVDDYSRYTTEFPLAKKSEVTSTPIWWLLTTPDTRGSQVRCLHSDRGGGFHSDVLAGFCGEQGIA
ncbi:unnamed protein product [Closterium sp. NIES-54]